MGNGMLSFCNEMESAPKALDMKGDEVIYNVRGKHYQSSTAQDLQCLCDEFRCLLPRI